MGFFRRAVSDQDWLLSALPLYESAQPIVGPISEALATGPQTVLNGAVSKALDELPSLADQLNALPSPTSRAARIAARNLRWSLNAYVRLAKELSSLSELSARGLHQVVTSHSRTGELLYSAHLSAIEGIAGSAARLMGGARGFFSGATRNRGVRAKPE
jgi:hypothetical protein